MAAPIYEGPHPLARAVEHIPLSVFAGSEDASRAVASQIADLIRERDAAGRRTVLGLATGSTPIGVYEEFVRLHRADGLSFRNVTTFNLDEYWPMQPGDIQSYRRFMREHLFDRVDINPANTHVPDGTLPQAGVTEFCGAYEQRIRDAGGIDLQILGVGRTGHIGFNEPGSARDSRTRLIHLDKVTRRDAASDFFGEWNVPRRAITMGVGTILEARRIVLIAFGEHKAGIIQRAVEGEVSAAVAASFLQQHPDARLFLDPAAAADLTRFKTPWRLGPIEEFGLTWDDAMTRRAVTWLSLALGRPILKLTDEDYNEHGLQDLVTVRGGAYGINIQVFKAFQRTITGWPGGHPERRRGEGRESSKFKVQSSHAETDGGTGVDGPESSVPATSSHAASRIVFPKRVLVFSPHPDDDVISMGGTLIRLCEQGHEVHVAYQTSGNIAVWDEAAERHADFAAEFCREFGVEGGTEQTGKIAERIRGFIRAKKAGEVDTPELQRIKGLIRRTEARAAARYSGVRPEHTHFLEMPFYETGRVRKKPIGDDDVKLVADLLDRVKPHQAYAAGDLSDPHGTHRVCLAAIGRALDRLADRPWMRECEVWLYRGAWQEWAPHEIDMAVPLSPDEVVRKRMAIFKHESQKDKALFPGPSDPREFWQRAEERNRHTADMYDTLGLPEYEAIEGFKLWRGAGTDMEFGR